MKDFDEFFRKRLEGERPFSKRDENWRQLSRRLDAFDTGIQNHGNTPRHWPKMLWQAAAFTAAAASAWIGWQNHALRMENKALHEQIVRNTPVEPVASIPVAPIPGGTEIPSTKAATGEPSASEPASISTAQNELRGQRASSTPQTTVGTRQPAGPAAPSPRIAQKNDQASWPPQKDTPQPVASNDATQQPANSSDGGGLVQNAKDQSAGQGDASPQLADSEPFVSANAVDVLPSRALDSVQMLNASQPKIPEGTKEIAASTAPAARPPIIRPVRQLGRLRVGIQAVAGVPVPAEKGVSLMTGQSLLAEARIFKGFWVGASADWLRYEISAEQNPRRFHLPEEPHFDPGGGGPQQHEFELKMVEAEQRQRRFSASLRYAVPTRGWLRPSVHVAHVWTQKPESLVSFRFEEEPHGGGPNPNNHDTMYFTKRSENQWFRNTWRFGAGAEVQLKNWALGLSADYDKSFTANDPLFDALLIRAGATYQF